MKRLFRNKSFSTSFILLSILFIAGQIFFGYGDHNKNLIEKGALETAFFSCLAPGYFTQLAFEKRTPDIVRWLNRNYKRKVLPQLTDAQL